MFIKIRNTTDTSTTIIVSEPLTIYLIEYEGLTEIINIIDSYTVNGLKPKTKYYVTSALENSPVAFMTYPKGYIFTPIGANNLNKVMPEIPTIIPMPLPPKEVI